MYHGDIGITKNYIEAYKWFILSKAQSNEAPEKANKILDSLEKLMTLAQIAEASKLVNQFEAQKE